MELEGVPSAQKGRVLWKDSAGLSILQTREPEVSTVQRLDVGFKG